MCIGQLWGAMVLLMLILDVVYLDFAGVHSMTHKCSQEGAQIC